MCSCASLIASLRFGAYLLTLGLLISGTILSTTTTGPYDGEKRAAFGFGLVFAGAFVFYVTARISGTTIFGTSALERGIRNRYTKVLTPSEEKDLKANVNRFTPAIIGEFALTWTLAIVAFFLAIIFAFYRGRTPTDWIVACMIASVLALGFAFDAVIEKQVHLKYLYYLTRYFNITGDGVAPSPLY